MQPNLSSNDDDETYCLNSIVNVKSDLNNINTLHNKSNGIYFHSTNDTMSNKMNIYDKNNCNEIEKFKDNNCYNHNDHQANNHFDLDSFKNNVNNHESFNNNNNNNKDINKKSSLKKKSKLFRFFAKLIKIMFSSIGLVGLVFVFSTCGALMFQILEQHEELRLCEEGSGKFNKELKSVREKIKLIIIYNLTLEELDSNMIKNKSNITFSNNIIEKINLNNDQYLNNMDYVINNNTNSNLGIKSTKTDPYSSIDSLLEDFRDVIIEISFVNKYQGRDCIDESRWNFFSSLLFTITLMSTVGFGHVAPLTWEGRVVCICFASIGIPIFMLCVAHLSRTFKKMIEILYVKLDSINPIKKYVNDCKQKRKEKRKANRLKKRNLRREKNNKKKYNRSSGPNEHANILLVSKDGHSIHSELALTHRNSYLLQDFDEYSYYDSDDESFDSELDENDEDLIKLENDEYLFGNTANIVVVPIWVNVLIINAYLFGGTLLFFLTEDWTIYESFYFVCVTLSTIGFGDLVPGQRLLDKLSYFKMVVVCFFQLFGMAIIAACFNLMKAAAKKYILKIAKKIKKFFVRTKYKHEVSALTQNKEREEFLNNIKLLQQYVTEVNATRNKTKKS